MYMMFVKNKRALEVDATYMLGYVVSCNGRRVFDLEETRAVLGYEPQDDAENFYNG